MEKGLADIRGSRRDFISSLVCRIMNRMASSEGEITQLSDTALMVAACRAHETALEDAFLCDPFAARLAGERGLAILRALPHSDVAQIGLAIRARFVDEVLLEALGITRLLPFLASVAVSTRGHGGSISRGVFAGSKSISQMCWTTRTG